MLVASALVAATAMAEPAPAMVGPLQGIPEFEPSK